MNSSKKYLLFIFAIMIIFSILPFSLGFKLTGFATKEVKEITPIPEIKTGEEKTYLYNKYSNNSGIIVSTPTSVSCKWKPDDKDDGWKVCEAIFEIEDKTNLKNILSSPYIDLSFRESEEIRNMEISFSQKFLIEEENYSEIVPQTSDNLEGVLTGFATKDPEEDENKTKEDENKTKEDENKTKEEKSSSSKKSKTKKVAKEEPKEKPEKTEKQIKEAKERREKILSNKKSSSKEEKPYSQAVTKKSSINKEEISFKKREFSSFSSTPIIKREDNAGKNFNFKINITDPELEETATPGILSRIRNIIRIIRPKERFNLNTEQPFAIKITFEIPKYNSNSFNFTISDEDFSATIDPEISGCGTLDTENAIYSLEKNVESLGICFEINASNITLDCQGHYIRYNSAGSPAHGVYSTANSTKVKNCMIISGDLNGAGGSGIYFSGADNGEIYNNNITIEDESQEGIFLESSTGAYVHDNKLNISESDSYGIYSDSSDLLRVENNEIISSSNVDAIYAESSSSVSINNNVLNISGEEGASIFIESASDSSITENTITSHSAFKVGIYVRANENYNIINNEISTSGENSNGIHVEYSSDGSISNNNILTTGDGAYGILMEWNSTNNNFSRNTINTQGEESNGLDISSESDSNIFNENNVLVLGNFSCAVLQDNSNSNVFTDNLFQSQGEEGYGIWIYDSTKTKISGNALITSGNNSPTLVLDMGRTSEIIDNDFVTSGESSYGLELDEFSNSNFFDLNNIETSGNTASGIFFLTDTTNNSFSNSNIKTYSENSYSIYLWGSNNNFEISDSSFNSTKDLFINTEVAGGNWNFINTQFTKDWSDGSSGSLNVKWYLDVSANYDDGDPIYEAVISAQNAIGEQEFSLSTDSNGEIPRQILKEYTQVGSTEKMYYSNYLIKASTSEVESEESVNMTENKEILFTFAEPSSGGKRKKIIPECIPEWECDSWGDCIDEKQSRVCIDKNNCEIEVDSKNKDTERYCKTVTKKWKTKNTLFDVNIEVLEKNENGMLLGTIGLINIGIPGEVIARLNYKIKNSKDEIVYEEDETVPVRTQIEFIKEINISNLPDGEYTWMVDLSYDGQTEPAQAEDSFAVGEKSSSRLIWLVGILSIIIIIAVIIIFTRKNKSEEIPVPEIKQEISPASSPSTPLTTTTKKVPVLTPSPTKEDPTETIVPIESQATSAPVAPTKGQEKEI